MRLYSGIDMIEISRIREAISRWGERFLGRIYTRSELACYRNYPESLAARFAGKEAVMKALSLPEGQFSWKDIEILSGENGRPFVNLYGQAQQQLEKLHLNRLEISLSHTRENAVAIVIGIRED